MIRRAASLVALCVAAAACAPIADRAPVDGRGSSAIAAGEEGGRECFYPRQVTGFRNAPESEDGASRIWVDLRAGETFEFDLVGPCRELAFARTIGFDTGMGVGRVCSGLEVDLLVPDPNLGTQRCAVSRIRRLEPGEEGARAGAREQVGVSR